MEIMYPFMLIGLYAAVVFSVRLNAKRDTVTSKDAIIKRTFKACLQSLESNVPGIIESTIDNIITIKNYYPDADYTKITGKLNKLAEENDDPSIRYKAVTAINFIRSDIRLIIQPKVKQQEHDFVFTHIAEQLEGKLLTSS